MKRIIRWVKAIFGKTRPVLKVSTGDGVWKTIVCSDETAFTFDNHPVDPFKPNTTDN